MEVDSQTNELVEQDIIHLDAPKYNDYNNLKYNDEYIRKKWSNGSKVQYFSNYLTKWVEAEIVEIFTNDNGKWYDVRYFNRKCEVQPFSNYIRNIDADLEDPAPDALDPTYDPEFGNTELLNKDFPELKLIIDNVFKNWQQWIAIPLRYLIIKYINESYIVEFNYKKINNTMKKRVIKQQYINNTSETITWYRMCYVENNLIRSTWNHFRDKIDFPDDPQNKIKWSHKRIGIFITECWFRIILDENNNNNNNNKKCELAITNWWDINESEECGDSDFARQGMYMDGKINITQRNYQGQNKFKKDFTGDVLYMNNNNYYYENCEDYQLFRKATIPYQFEISTGDTFKVSMPAIHLLAWTAGYNEEYIEVDCNNWDH